MNEREPVDPLSESAPPSGAKRGLSREESMRQAGPYMTLGIQLVLTMVALGALGWWLDGRLNTAPWLMVSGLLMGAVGGMLNVIRMALRSSKESAARARMKSASGREPSGGSNDSNSG